MTHPLTPREKVAGIVSGAEVRVEYDSVGRQYTFVRDAVGTADAILTAFASGSGDHAELARLVEWRDRLRADPGRAAHFGSPYADKPMQNGRTYWNSDLADDITALIAEVAALKDYGKSVAKEALAYRNALLLVKDRLKTWPIDDHENCMCGSTVDSHNMGSGHSPVAVADHAIDLIIQQIEETLNDPMGIQSHST